MSKTIFAGLKDKTQVILFGEDSNDFNNIKELFSFNLADYAQVDFVNNLNSNLDENEIYYIVLSEEDENLLFSDIKLNLDSVDNNVVKQNEYKNINSIYLIDSDLNVNYLKRVFPTEHIKSKRFLGFNDAPTFKEEADKINLSFRIDVFYNISDKKLYFRKFNVLKSLFPEAIKFYRAATKEDVKAFFVEEKFDFNDKLLDKSTDKLRKRLGQLIDSGIDISDPELMEKYEKYDKEYKNKLKIKDGKYILKTKAELDNFIELIEEKFYETPISKEKRTVDNFRKLG